MTGTVWVLYVFMAILLWSATSLLYKAGARGVKEDHICLKFSICVGMVFFVIALAYLMMREEPFTIWESAVRYWPMTLFGLVYAAVNTISYKGYVYNEATVESPVEGISGGTSTVLLIIAYLVLGRVDSVSELLSPLRTAGILVILISIILLSTARNRESRNNTQIQKAGWMRLGLGTLIFPVIFAVIDGFGDNRNRNLPGHNLWLCHAGGRQHYHCRNGICAIRPGVLDLSLLERRENLQSIHEAQRSPVPWRACG